MAYANFQIIVEDYTLIQIGDSISVIFEFEGSPNYIDLIANTSNSGVNFAIGATNYATAGNIKDRIDALYGLSGTEFQLPITTSLIQTTPTSWSVLVEFEEYGIGLLDQSAITGITINVTQEEVENLEITFDSITPAEDNPSIFYVKHNFSLTNEVYPVTLRYGDLGTKVCASSADLFFEYRRFSSGATDSYIRTITVTDDELKEATVTIPNVSTFEHGGVTVVNSESDGQATALSVITNSGDVALTFTYAIAELVDGEPQTPMAQSSNIFENVEIGIYRSYITDQFGAVLTDDFEIVGGVQVTKPEPVIMISNANSLKFWNSGQGLFDNQRFADQSEKYVNVEMHDYYQRVKTTDLIATQIKTSYDNIAVSVKNCDGETVLNPMATLKKQLIGLIDKRDCTVKRTDDGLQFFVYFKGGNTYEPGTTDVIGTYSPMGVSLPNFQQVGNFVQLESGATGIYEVVEIVYNNDLGRWALVCDGILPISGEVYARCETTYNAEDWNVLEFETAFSLLDDGIYFVEVDFTDEDPRYADSTWTSEPVTLQETFDDNVVVEFSNSEPSNQMDWSTGIISKLNVPARVIKWAPKFKSERFSSDSDQSKTLKSIITRTVSFESGLLPQYLGEKLMIASGCDQLIIDGTEFSVPEDPEVVPKIDDNNPFYLITMVLQMTNGAETGPSVGLVSGAPYVFGLGESDVYGL